MNEIKPEQMWVDINGGLYKVAMLVNMNSENHEEFPPSVVYIQIKDATVWCKPITQWRNIFIRHTW